MYLSCALGTISPPGRLGGARDLPIRHSRALCESGTEDLTFQLASGGFREKSGSAFFGGRKWHFWHFGTSFGGRKWKEGRVLGVPGAGAAIGIIISGKVMFGVLQELAVRLG